MLQLTNPGSSLEIASLTHGCITSSNWKALAPAGSRPLWRGLAPLRRRVGRLEKIGLKDGACPPVWFNSGFSPRRPPF